MNSSPLCSLMFSVCLILISHSLFPANARAHGQRRLISNADMINEVCRQTSDQNITCTDILKSNTEIAQTTNYFDFSKAILEFSLKEGQKGLTFLQGLLKNDSSPALEECTNFCYTEVVDSFSSALGELKESPDTANYDAKVAGDGPALCEDVLAEAHIVNPAISALNHKIALLSLIAFLATNNLPSDD